METLQLLGVSAEPEVRTRLRPLLVSVTCETLLPLKMVTQYRFAMRKPLKTCGSGSA